MTRFEKSRDAINGLLADKDLMASEPTLFIPLDGMKLGLYHDTFEVPTFIEDIEIQDWLLGRAVAEMLSNKRSLQVLAAAAMPTGIEDRVADDEVSDSDVAPARALHVNRRTLSSGGPTSTERYNA